jgi:hypothetical protein
MPLHCGERAPFMHPADSGVETVIGRAAAYLLHPAATWRCRGDRAKLLVVFTYSLAASYAVTMWLLQ